MDPRFTPAGRIRSFGYACRGLAALLRAEPNAWIHAAATIAVVALALALDVGREGWTWLVAAIAAVWIAEAFNTAFERLADAVHPEPHPLVRDAKDVAAGAVLVAAMGAVAIGLSVLGPPLLRALGLTS